MPLSLHEARRYARQLALPNVGLEGQMRLRAATVLLVDDPRAKVAVETAALYLRGAGVGNVRVAGPVTDWGQTLVGIDLAIRFDLDDDALSQAAMLRRMPLVVARLREESIEILAFRRQRPCGHGQGAASFLPSASSQTWPGRNPVVTRDERLFGAAATVAGTVAASEALFVLIAGPDASTRGRPGGARLVQLPLGSSESSASPMAADLPWPPPCPLCGSSKEIPS